jgi:hypothetical protein
MRPIFFCTQLFGLAVWTCVPSIHNDFEKEKMVSVPTICNFRFFPSLPRTAASCAERIYGSTEIPLSFVNSPPSAGRRGRRGRRKYAEDFQRKDAKAQRREEFPERITFATSHEKAAWFS